MCARLNLYFLLPGESYYFVFPLFFSVRLWSVPVAAPLESYQSSNQPVEVIMLIVVILVCRIKVLSSSYLCIFFFLTAASRICLEECILVSFVMSHLKHFVLSVYCCKKFSNVLPIYILIRDFVIFRAVDHQWEGELFATAGAQVNIWNHNR